ncbi:MAG: site-specific DNA-methyltransferase [Methylococcaceae bacterium]
MAKIEDSNGQQSGNYTHSQEAIQRPDVGIQPEFNGRKPPKNYRYDSSLAPELSWDENAEREFAEWLLNLISNAAEQGEAKIFSQPQSWQGTEEKFSSIRECVARLKSLTQPFLNWAGKAERRDIKVPTIPLFVHERHSTQAILKTLESYRAAGTNLDLFGDPELDISDKLDAYQHKGPWTNRLIQGDSLQVMNSLLEYEGLGGQVQMIYMDPPYGVKFGSNFQPFVRKRDVKHGKDEEMIREPEMVKAYRDTWELGLHSYLTYLRDRLLLARELLTESGSVFVQISDENVHHVREVMDEVFGPANFCGEIIFRKTSGASSTLLGTVNDFILWYAKDENIVKYNQLFQKKVLGGEGTLEYKNVELTSGEIRRLSNEEYNNPSLLPDGAKIFVADPVVSAGAGKSENQILNFEKYGKKYTINCGPKRHWKTTVDGMQKLWEIGRLLPNESLRIYKRYFNDFPYIPYNTLWDDTRGETEMSYVVQTSTKVVHRCLLMTTDPGDLVLDPTCGSGTTAMVAEQWGRRWITCDTSRVPLALTRQRLLTATFPWYELKEPQRGPSGGLVYKRKQNKKGEETGGLVPHITLKSIANNEEPETVTLVDKPETNNIITRVCGPFTVEATIQAAQSIEDYPLPNSEGEGVKEVGVYENPRAYLDRMIEVLRQSKTLRLPGNKSLQFDNVRTLAAANHEHLHAEAVEQSGETKRIAVVFGPEDGALNSNDVLEASREAYYLKFDALYFFGFAIQAKARELIEDRGKLKLPCSYVAVTPDVVMSDLLKTSKASEIFSVTGLPDIDFGTTGEKSPTGDKLYQVTLLGLDIFRPHDLETESIAAENLPCWMLDTDYNGMCFCARQVFFPKTSAWDNLQKSLKGRFSDSVWEHLAGVESEPFVLGLHKRIAVKVIDERGNELMVIRDAI